MQKGSGAEKQKRIEFSSVVLQMEKRVSGGHGAGICVRCTYNDLGILRFFREQKKDGKNPAREKKIINK